MFKVNEKSNGLIECFKSRLVAQGYKQQYEFFQKVCMLGKTFEKVDTVEQILWKCE